jgi:hypothetical protein
VMRQFSSLSVAFRRSANEPARRRHRQVACRGGCTREKPPAGDSVSWFSRVTWHGCAFSCYQMCLHQEYTPISRTSQAGWARFQQVSVTGAALGWRFGWADSSKHWPEPRRAWPACKSRSRLTLPREAACLVLIPASFQIRARHCSSRTRPKGYLNRSAFTSQAAVLVRDTPALGRPFSDSVIPGVGACVSSGWFKDGELCLRPLLDLRSRH